MLDEYWRKHNIKNMIKNIDLIYIYDIFNVF